MWNILLKKLLDTDDVGRALREEREHAIKMPIPLYVDGDEREHN